MGRVLVRVAVLAAVVLGACASGEQQAGGRKGKRATVATTQVAARSFNSALSLEVWVQVARDSMAQCVGSTPVGSSLTMPDCVSWWVKPVGAWDWAMLVREMDQEEIPGLALPAGAQDADLGQVAACKGLQTLVLRGTQVTDTGLAQLKELTGLQVLDLGGTQVTDAGLDQLKDLKGLRVLQLWGTRVTRAGLRRLQRELPNCLIY